MHRRWNVATLAKGNISIGHSKQEKNRKAGPVNCWVLMFMTSSRKIPNAGNVYHTIIPAKSTMNLKNIISAREYQSDLKKKSK